MATKRTIHVVGTGTIGEPLLGLLLHTQRALEVDEITFHKHSPRLGDRAKITNLMRRGARLAVDAEKRTDFEKLGLQPVYTTEEALVPGEDRFVQVVSCNTHNLAVLIATLALHDEAPDNLLEGRFVCMRRSSDISQEKSFIAAPEAGSHKDAQFGTHHAHDAWHLFQTRGFDLNLFSSVIKLNTQYMHSIWFNLRVRCPVTLDDVIEKLVANPYVALTHKIMAGPIFSFGRDHGYFGRLLNQTVVSIPTLTVRDGHEITG